MSDPRNYDDDYYTLKVWRDKTKPAFVRLKALRQLREGQDLDNVSFLHAIITEALANEEKLHPGVSSS